MLSEIIQKKIRAIEDETKFVANLDFKCDPKDCPLEKMGNHSELAQLLWSKGSFEWDCEFCGTHFEE